MSCEDEVFGRLRAKLTNQKNVQIISLHPPSGKAYETALVGFPIFDQGTRTRGRSHVDTIFISSQALFLLELKCFSHESADDIEKLRRIRDQLGLTCVIEVISKRVPDIGSDRLNMIQELILGLAVEHHDTELPEDFIILECQSRLTLAHAGSRIPASVKTFLRDFADQVTF